MLPRFRALSLVLLLSCAGCSDRDHSRTATTTTQPTGGPTVAPPDSHASKPAPAIPTFRGPISTLEQKQAIGAFLENLPEEDSIIALDLALSDEQLSELGPDDMNRLYLSLVTPVMSDGRDGGLTGYELLILLSEPGHPAAPFNLSRTPGSGRLSGTFRILSFSGLNEGITSVAVVPVQGP